MGGTFSATPEKISVEVALHKVGKDEPLEQWTLEAAPDGFFDIENQLSTKVLHTLGIKEPVRRPPPLAFDHRLLLRMAVKTVRAHLEDPRTLRPLLPQTFSMKTLRETCEIVLGKRLDPRAFARRVRAAGYIRSAKRGVYRF